MRSTQVTEGFTFVVTNNENYEKCCNINGLHLVISDDFLARVFVYV